jgi:putative NADH-flavin reductase
MKLVVLGSTGGCGVELVQQAYARGHEVTAVARRHQEGLPPGVRGVVADILDADRLAEVIARHDAVLCAVGLRLPGLAPWARPEVPDLLSRLGPALVQAMRATELRRVMAISAGGVGDSYTRMPWAFRTFIRTTALRLAYAELEQFEATLLGSGLDVCMVRPTGLTNGSTTGQVKVYRDCVGMAQISRADVAAFMLDHVGLMTWPWRTPLITVTGGGEVLFP